MATTTIKCWLNFTNGVATVALNSGNSGNAGVSLAALLLRDQSTACS